MNEINNDIRNHLTTLFAEGKIEEINEIVEEVMLDMYSKSY